MSESVFWNQQIFCFSVTLKFRIKEFTVGEAYRECLSYRSEIQRRGGKARKQRILF